MSSPHSPCPIATHAAHRPQAPALIAPGSRWTYAELDARVAATADALRTQGASAGDRIALRWPRSPAAVVLIAALARIGAVVALLSHRLPPGGVVHACERIGAKALCTCESDIAESARANRLPVWMQSGLPQSANASVPSDAHIRLEEPGTLIFTSGSTGTPKAVLHTWGQHAASARGSETILPLRSVDRWLLSLPLYHVGGLAILVRCVRAGAAVVFPDAHAPLAHTLSQHAITHASLVPTQLRRLLRCTDRAPSSLQGVLLGGAALPPALIGEALDAGWPLHTTYGCTEMASQIATTPPDASRECLLHTAGQPLPHVELTTDDQGELLVRGASLFCGYVEGDAVTPARTSDGWYRTGDVGHFDTDGFLHVDGRADRMFISGGENIHPEEIEAALRRLKDVEEAAVAPVPDPEFGHRPVAFVRMTDGRPPPSSLQDRLADVLPSFKIPVSFFALPNEALENRLKVDRTALAQKIRTMLSSA